MSKNHSLVAGFVFDGKGGVKPLSYEQLIAGPDLGENGFYWVHFDLSGPHNWVIHDAGLDSVAVRSVTALETRPRCTPHLAGALLTLRGVNLNPGEYPEDMVALRMWVDKNRLISIRRRKLVAVNEIRVEFEKTGIGPRTADELLLRIIRELNDRIEPYVDKMSDSIDEHEVALTAAPSSDIRKVISDIRHGAAQLRRYIAPQREALNRLSLNETHILSDKTVLAVREEADRLTRLVEELETVRERTTLLHEQVMAHRAEQMNQNMMILSVLSAVFLPLGFITGLLGINVGGMPGANSPAAFWIVVLLCVGLAGILFYVFKKRGWL